MTLGGLPGGLTEQDFGQVDARQIRRVIPKIVCWRLATLPRRSGRVVEGSGFENRRSASYRGFESLLLRHIETLCGTMRFVRRCVDRDSPHVRPLT